MHYILFYEVVENYVERRAEFRAQHLADGAVLVFRSAKAAEDFARDDPYVRNGLITAWRVRAWNTVIGDGETL